MKNLVCPNCGVITEPFKRESLCCNCGMKVFGRRRFGDDSWINEQDLPFIIIEQSMYRQSQLHSVEEVRSHTQNTLLNALDGYRSSGVVKSVRFCTGGDEFVCTKCALRSERSYQIRTNEGFELLRKVIFEQNCNNLYCRCFLRPNEISID
jgi:hypothetical protein